MSHAPDIDFEAESRRAMPVRFCRTRWKELVAGCSAIAAVVLGYSVHVRFHGQQGLASKRMGAGAVRQVAFTTTGASGGRAVRWVGRRVAFHGAADVIRPAVLEVRVALGPTTNGSPAAQRTGSAVVVDSRGYAVTCRHVVAGAERIAAQRFRQADRWLPAEVVAASGDLALLRVSDSTPFSAATFADSNTVQVGDWVLAAGHPFGLGLTVTAGIVGQRHATLTLPNGQVYPDLLQTDAPINEGSSGGPLVNAAGQVVGVNTAIYAPTGVFAGAGFAIPGNRVKQFVASALGNAAVNAGRGSAWGLGLAELTPDLCARVSCPATQGVMVDNVVQGSAAYAAQLARGDVVTAIAGQPVRDLVTARRIHEQVAGARSVTLEVWRRGATLTVVLHPPISQG